jgi:hypothetical protein
VCLGSGWTNCHALPCPHLQAEKEAREAAERAAREAAKEEARKAKAGSQLDGYTACWCMMSYGVCEHTYELMSHDHSPLAKDV